MTRTIWEIGDRVVTPHGAGSIVGFGWVDVTFAGPSVRTALVAVDGEKGDRAVYVKDLREAQGAPRSGRCRSQTMTSSQKC